MFGKILVAYNILKFKILNIPFGKHLRIRGHLQLQIQKHGYLQLGDNVTIVSGNSSNPMGRNVNSSIRVHSGAECIIGDNTGLTSSCIWASTSIIIGNNVKIGALTIITDNDAHSISPSERANPSMDFPNAKKARVKICDNVFIGTGCFIGKGVTIGRNCVIGARSVVTKSIPENEMWAGNPARFIKRMETI